MKCSFCFKLMLWPRYLTLTHEIFTQKIGAKVLFESFFRIIFAFLEAEWHRFHLFWHETPCRIHSPGAIWPCKWHAVTILAINISTALKCHNSLNFNCRRMIFFSKFASSKNLSNETKLVPVRNESQMNKTFAFCKCGWANLS